MQCCCCYLHQIQALHYHCHPVPRSQPFLNLQMCPPVHCLRAAARFGKQLQVGSLLLPWLFFGMCFFVKLRLHSWKPIPSFQTFLHQTLWREKVEQGNATRGLAKGECGGAAPTNVYFVGKLIISVGKSRKL